MGLGSTTCHRSPGWPGTHIGPEDIIFVRTVWLKMFLVGAWRGDGFAQCGLKLKQDKVSVLASGTLEKWEAFQPRGRMQTVRLKRNHAPSRDDLRTARLKITRSKNVANGLFRRASTLLLDGYQFLWK